MQNNETELEDDLRPEYDRSVLKNGVRGKHYQEYQSGTNVALLAPDVRAAFPTDQELNDALRMLMRLAKQTVSAA